MSQGNIDLDGSSNYQISIYRKQTNKIKKMDTLVKEVEAYNKATMLVLKDLSNTTFNQYVSKQLYGMLQEHMDSYNYVPVMVSKPGMVCIKSRWTYGDGRRYLELDIVYYKVNFNGDVGCNNITSYRIAFLMNTPVSFDVETYTNFLTKVLLTIHK